MVLQRNRTIHAENHRRAYAQLCQIQHTQYFGKQPVHAQIRRGKVADKDHSADKQHEHIQRLPADAGKHVNHRILFSHFSTISYSVSKGVSFCLFCSFIQPRRKREQHPLHLIGRKTVQPHESRQNRGRFLSIALKRAADFSILTVKDMPRAADFTDCAIISPYRQLINLFVQRKSAAFKPAIRRIQHFDRRF